MVGVCGDVNAHQDSLDEREEFIALIRLHTARRLGATQRSGRRENIDCQKYRPVMFETALTQHLTPRAVGRVCPEMSTPEVSAGYEGDGYPAEWDTMGWGYWNFNAEQARGWGHRPGALK